jgi:hypothetical protein
MAQLKTQFKCMTHAKKHISTLMNTFNKDELIENELIREIVRHHPTKNIKDNDVLVMKIRPPYNKLSLYYRNNDTGKLDDISWVLCIRNIYGKYDVSKEKVNDITSAFRFESNKGTKLDFKRENTFFRNGEYMGQCNHCNKITKNIDTDHYPIPFKKIFNDFMKINRIRKNNIEIYENEINELRLKDKVLTSRWLQYHDSVASYRMLCKSCNCSFGSYGH